MKQYFNVFTAYIIMGILIILVGILQSWGVALAILNLCLISAVMTMGANIQWGYAGLINFGIMGYVALGGLAAVLVSVRSSAFTIIWLRQAVHLNRCFLFVVVLMHLMQVGCMAWQKKVKIFACLLLHQKKHLP